MKTRVLVVDDFPLMRAGLVAALEADPDIDVVGDAPDGDEGLALARRLKPDVVVTDLRMAGAGGAILLARLRDEVPSTRVLVLAASEQPEPFIDAVAAGAAGYVIKHVTGEELRHAVITIHGGGSVVAPALASHLVRGYAQAARGERPTVAALEDVEQEVLRLIMEGWTDREIGVHLYVSIRTVQNHLTRIREKTGKRRRSELARWGVEHAIA